METERKSPAGIRAVMFDLDGTLTDTLRDIGDAMNWALEQYGLPGWATEEYRYLVGNGAKVLARRAVRDRQDLAEQVHAAYQRQYETHNMIHTRPYPGIPELLERLQRRGILLCVLSNKPDRDTKHVVSHYFPGIRFRTVLGQTDRFPLKPDPAAALSIAEELGVDPEEFAYLGDTSVDMTCAKRAGMHATGVLWGFRDAGELTESGAEHLLEKPEDFFRMYPLSAMK